MQHAFSSNRLQAGDHLKHRVHSLRRRERTVPIHLVSQRTTPHQLRDDDRDTVDLLAAEDIDHVRMAD